MLLLFLLFNQIIEFTIKKRAINNKIININFIILIYNIKKKMNIYFNY